MRTLTAFTAPREWSFRNLSPDLAGDILGDIDLFVDSFLQPTHARGFNVQTTCDVRETDEHYLVSFDMPGVKKEDIKIELKNSQLVVSGERHRVINGSETIDKFERAFRIPNLIDSDKIEANYENGVLSLAMPKAESAKPRSIEIQSGPTGFFSKLISSKKELKDTKVS